MVFLALSRFWIYLKKNDIFLFFFLGLLAFALLELGFWSRKMGLEMGLARLKEAGLRTGTNWVGPSRYSGWGRRIGSRAWIAGLWA